MPDAPSQRDRATPCREYFLLLESTRHGVRPRQPSQPCEEVSPPERQPHGDRTLDPRHRCSQTTPPLRPRATWIRTTPTDRGRHPAAEGDDQTACPLAARRIGGHSIRPKPDRRIEPVRVRVAASRLPAL